jgi:hypothetical protein
MKSLFLHDWSEGGGNYKGSGLTGLKADFQIDDAALEGVEVLVASYTYEDYSGSAYVLFEKNGHLFEVHGSHCSCYGLEDQWEPEAVTREAILRRLKGSWGEEGRIKDHIREALA